MTILTFYKRLEREDIFANETFDLLGETLKINNFKSKWVTFESCVFNCEKLCFENILDGELFLEFNNCTFNTNISFNNCKIDTLKFLNTKNVISLNINGNPHNIKEKCEINSFSFVNTLLDIKSSSEKSTEIILASSFSFSRVFFKKSFEFNYINNSKGILNFSNNIVGDKQNVSNSSCVFHCSNISNVKFSNNIFNTYTSFKNSTFSFNKDNFQNTGSYWNKAKFERNEFNKVSFNKVEFKDYFEFDNCDFLSTTWYENCKNIENTNLKFVACEFKGFSLFNNSTLNFLDIDRCTFHKSSSFTDAKFNKIKFYEVKFLGGVYFDELKIYDVINNSYLKDKTKILEWKRTLRTIKQELQKTENKIDFYKFRAYELAAHYEELNYKENNKDVAILWATKLTTDFGINWIKALYFTLKWGFVFYAMFYIVENHSNTIDISNWDNWTRFSSGFFRFFLVTDFYSPLETDKVYLINPLSWLFFIFGKIVIAFGIYEMIQSFRKFKA